MKIRLLENVSSHGLNGCKGQELEVDDAVAVELEKHGYAEFIGDAPVVTSDAEASDDAGDETAAKTKKKKK